MYDEEFFYIVRLEEEALREEKREAEKAQRSRVNAGAGRTTEADPVETEDDPKLKELYDDLLDEPE